jgi:hypothetical protein
MRLTSILATALIFCLACNESKRPEETVDNDTTTVIETETEVIENQPVDPTPSTATEEPIMVSRVGELIEVGGKMVYSSEDYSFLSDPYGFPLDASTIENLLGEKAETKVQEFEGGEDYSAYTYSTITFEDSEISFYSYSGKHSSTIRTPLLPLKNEVMIGMKKEDFLTAMSYDDVNTSEANVFRLFNDYGSMNFSFQADTLYLIHAYYEEGD